MRLGTACAGADPMFASLQVEHHCVVDDRPHVVSSSQRPFQADLPAASRSGTGVGNLAGILSGPQSA
jgi:hypothetical protein